MVGPPWPISRIGLMPAWSVPPREVPSEEPRTFRKNCSESWLSASFEAPGKHSKAASLQGKEGEG